MTERHRHLENTFEGLEELLPCIISYDLSMSTFVYFLQKILQFVVTNATSKMKRL